ncbi:hypothetical protein KO566_11605 [Flavobacteriaceae bacterium XHP0103]|uniref:hypothetical protein n=1 Tax=Marixanthotalea marina TaxID=2844359 RepID=UPI002989F0D5|nr:hypothetical protein [Marixanthotalea marina]MBU3822710.1 hypothetical protein [Marixanthotalea marina]
MLSIKQTDLYPEVVKELNYPFGDIFIFKGYLVSEIKEGVTFNWEDHGKVIVEDVVAFLKTDGRDLVYISNRINAYSVVAADWIKFFKRAYTLKAYCIVSQGKLGVMNYMVENLFFSKKIKRFNTVFEAVNWVKNNMTEIE